MDTMTHFDDVRSRIDPASKVHIVRDWNLLDYNNAGKQFVDKARSLLSAIDHGDPELSRAASVQLDEVVLAWWEQALAANMAKPEMVQAALTTRMDNNAVSEMSTGVIAKAVQEMRLSESQKDTIATAYSRYRNTTLPSIEKRQVILQQLTEAASNDSSQQEESGPSFTQVLGQLDACLQNTQQACTALTNVSTCRTYLTH